MIELSQEYILECLDINFQAGTAKWNDRPREHFPTERGWKIFNKLYAGNVAGYLSSDGYYNIEVDGIAYRLHRLIYVAYHGYWPSQVDHINRDRGDNRITNLREVDQFQNQRNASKRSDNTSGVTGVSWLERLKKWQASIYHNGRSIYLGVFSDINDAIAVRKAAEIEFGFSEGHGSD